ncbi:MAG TPA: type II toxin-antitoxin system VapB family antitoxin [bacterium]|nr:type II toxin-antitoxin system VapB family antitoxin [bacterium]
MRTTLNLNEEIYQQAARATGIKLKTELIHLGLKALIRESARERLSTLHGAVKKAMAAKRRRM